MKTIVVIKDGEEKLRIPAEIINGHVYGPDQQPITIGYKLEAAGIDKKAYCNRARNHSLTEADKECVAVLGDNGQGMMVRWAADIEAEREAERQAAYDALPAKVRAAREERQAIDRLFYQADRAYNHDTDDNNIERAMRLRSEARSRLDAWKKNYPEAAAEETKADMIAKAEKLEDLATGALTYDADGWISPEEQQNRHDKMMAEAAEIRKQAGV